MVNFTNSSIDLMEKIAIETSNVLKMTRRGYALATRRADIDELISELHAGYGSDEAGRAANAIFLQTGCSNVNV